MTPPVNGQDDPNAERRENVVALPTLAERDRVRKERERQERRSLLPAEPMINMPPVTKYLLGVIILAYIATGVLLSAEQSDAVIETLGFVPAKFSSLEITPAMLATPLTHMFLHGSWMHIILNAFMLAAFGSGVERWLGSRRLLILFFASGLCGAFAHYLLNTASSFVMIGASGGLSGLFAGALVMINRGQQEMGGRIGILPFALLWIGLSVGFGMLGGPDGSAIAWAAHVGGFLGGFLVLKAMRV